jgi:hypothetical protein
MSIKNSLEILPWKITTNKQDIFTFIQLRMVLYKIGMDHGM